MRWSGWWCREGGSWCDVVIKGSRLYQGVQVLCNRAPKWMVCVFICVCTRNCVNVLLLVCESCPAPIV